MAAQAKRKSNTAPKISANQAGHQLRPAGYTASEGNRPQSRLNLAEGETKYDPHTLIEQHRAAYQAWHDTIEANGFGSDGNPKLERKADRLFQKLIQTDPRTVGGAAALLKYIAECERPFLDDMDAPNLMVRLAGWLENHAGQPTTSASIGNPSSKFAASTDRAAEVREEPESPISRLVDEYTKCAHAFNALSGRISRLHKQHSMQIEGVTVGTFIHPGKKPQTIVARTHKEIDAHVMSYDEHFRWMWGKSTATLARQNLKRNVLHALLQRQINEYDRLMKEVGAADLEAKMNDMANKSFQALEQFIEYVPKTLAECRTKARLAMKLEKQGNLGEGDHERIIESIAR